jgi:hypothetical protein
MKKMRQKKDFTDDDISEFQNEFDLFYQDWVHMYGYKAVTNYIHIMSSGDICLIAYINGGIFMYILSKGGSH